MTKPIKVLVNGAKGKMGLQTIETIQQDPELTLRYALDKNDSLNDICQNQKPDVIIDFTNPVGLKKRIKSYISQQIPSIIGATGLSETDQNELHLMAKKHHCTVWVCPNFSISALLMMKYAAEAAKYMPHIEIIEYHHDQKADAPSGTAIKTADLIQKTYPNVNQTPLPEKDVAIGSRGAKTGNIPIHAIRLPGFVADQDVILGGDDQTLLIRQTTLSRKAFMPGVRFALKNYHKLSSGLHYGLELLLFSET